MSPTADTTDGKTGYRSSADACRCGRYFWQKRKCLRPHISHLQWWASIATAATVSRFLIMLFLLGSYHQCRKLVGHLCCKLYCFVFLEFLEIQRWNTVLSLSFSQPDFQHRHKQLVICVSVCSRICATIHQACFLFLRN